MPLPLRRTTAAAVAAVLLAPLGAAVADPGSTARGERWASAPHLPANRYAGPDGTSSMHGDAGASDTTPYADPGAAATLAQPVVLGSVCPTILAGGDGMPIALCTEYVDRAPTVNLLDPTTLLPVARLHLSAGALLGGVYAYVDDRDRLVTVDGGSGDVVRIAHDQDGPLGTWELRIDDRFPTAPAFAKVCGSTTCDAIATVSPGYDGRIWFATSAGRVGFVDPRTKRVALRTLGAPRTGGASEKVFNSIATGPDGAAITTDHALYLARATRDGAIRIVWRRAYDRGPARKPGQLSYGSGATPTYFGPRTGHEYVAITDNAAPREHLLVYRADTGRLVCSAPLFTRAASGTENSPIGIGRSVFVASTFGYPYPAGTDGTPSQPASADFTGGMQRIDLTRDGCRTVWHTDTASSAVPRFSRAEQVIYTVTRDASQVYRLVRLSPDTGKMLSSLTLGVGPTADTLQMVGTILRDGTLLQGNVTGYTAVRPGD